MKKWNISKWIFYILAIVFSLGGIWIVKIIIEKAVKDALDSR